MIDSAPKSPLGDPRSLAKNRVWDFFEDSTTLTRDEQPANADSAWGLSFLTENSRRGVLDQLITSTAPTGTTSYSYDASGNLIEKSAPEGVTTYGYDWQDR
ncbi:MAG: RHS repeat protein, partial [Deltaproteobacteria bacterium]|nr:RHS repeat protein [Deltaproteobacteria bacterium]